MRRWPRFAWSVKWWERFAVVMLLGIGIAARVHQSDYNFDGDELFSVEIASKPLPEVISLSLEDRPHPPLYNLVLHFWIRTFGASEQSTRLSSVALSAGFLLLAYSLFRRIVAPRIALGALALLAVSPFFVYYGQQARPYAMIGLLSLANLFVYILLLESPRSFRCLFIWASTCELLLYTQYLAGLLIGLEISIALYWLRTSGIKIALVGLGGLALIAPWLILAMYEPVSRGLDPLSHISWLTRPSAADFAGFYVSVFGFIPGIVTRWLAVLLAVAGLSYVFKIRRARELGAVESVLLIVAFGMPTIVFAISILGPKPLFLSRQMIAAATAFIGVIGLAASSLKKGWDIPFLVALIAWTTMGLPSAFPQSSKPPWRHVAEDLNRHYPGQSVVVFERWVEAPLRYYRGGHVRGWDELSDGEKKRRFLLLSRPFLDSRPEIEKSTFRRILLTSYHWGRQVGSGPPNDLNLYEVVPISDT